MASNMIRAFRCVSQPYPNLGFCFLPNVHNFSNLIIWFRRNAAPQLMAFGIMRMVRDVFHIPGQLELDAQGRLRQISLHAQHPLAKAFKHTLIRAFEDHHL